ncbi:hypothetical protein TNCV_4592431 [Trichonephila clavipes]|nr:hypothetical protein TNCV_4592431 [Trichonephila clavipes]
MLRLKKRARMQIFSFSRSYAGSRPEFWVRTRWYTNIVFNSSVKPPPCYMSLEVDWTRWTYCFASRFPRPESSRFLIQLTSPSHRIFLKARDNTSSVACNCVQCKQQSLTIAFLTSSRDALFVL